MVSAGMHSARYYRMRAARVRRIAEQLTHPEVCAALDKIAADFDDIAIDLERGLIEIRHPEQLPQRQSGDGGGDPSY
jgi:hypothetical protein